MCLTSILESRCCGGMISAIWVAQPPSQEQKYENDVRSPSRPVDTLSKTWSLCACVCVASYSDGFWNLTFEPNNVSCVNLERVYWPGLIWYIPNVFTSYVTYVCTKYTVTQKDPVGIITKTCSHIFAWVFFPGGFDDNPQNPVSATVNECQWLIYNFCLMSWGLL